MVINPKIQEYLKEVKVPLKDGLPYLVSLHFNCMPSYIPQELIKKVYSAGIFTYSNNKIIWNVELFQTSEETGSYSWVKSEYVPLFKEKNSKKGGKVREATSRMKKLFQENPEIRKEDVMDATKLYLFNTDPNYIRFPHFFIYKGVGADKTWDILDWIEKAKIVKKSAKGRTSNRNTMK